MSKISTLIFCCFFTLSGLYGMAAPGKCVFTFIPNGLEGSSGSWKANVFSSNGHGFSTDSIDCSSTTPVVLTIESPAAGLVELGYYIIELVCDIKGPISGPFLDSISVQVEGPDAAEDIVSNTIVPTLNRAAWDTIIYKNIPTLANGERTEIFYAIPTLPFQ
jgi:hypothetical protein